MKEEIYENERKILLDLVKDYKKSLVESEDSKNLDPLEVLFFLSSFGVAGVLSLALERYFDKVEKNEYFKAIWDFDRRTL